MAQENYDIFISYSRKDSAIADQICAALDSAGITYFIDRQGIGGGFEFPAVLAENIVNSQIFLLLASKNSYESKFTMNEIVFAFNKKPKNAILPYIIDNSSLPISLEFVFAGINWRNMTDHPIDPTLVDDLLRMLGRERVKKAVKEGNVHTEVVDKLTEREEYLLSLPDNEFVSYKDKKSGKYGFKLKTIGEIVISFKYDDVGSFSNGLAEVKLNNKWGYVDKTGKEITPLKYDGVERFFAGLARVRLNTKYGFIDNAGKEIIPLKYDEAGVNFIGLSRVKLNGKWGYIDKTGKELIPLKYEAAGYFSEGLAPVNLNYTWGFVDKTDNVVIPFKYDDAESFCEGLARVRLNYKFGFVDKMGNEVIPLTYDDAWSFTDGKAKVYVDNEYFYIDKNGNRID